MESELTKFIKQTLRDALEPKLRELNFFAPSLEKRFEGIPLSFDVYSYKKFGNKCFAIWELEISSPHHEVNVKKQRKVLNFKWQPTVFLFHVFSPDYYDSQRKACHHLAKKLEDEFPRRFVYTQLEISTDYEKFIRIKNSFESSKNYAKQYYGKDVINAMRKIARQSISVLKN